MNLFVSTISLAIGGFVAVSPSRAAKIWGWKNFDELAPNRRTWYLRCYRTFGILIGMAGILYAVDSIWFH
jgi:hypothetical protein